MSLSKNWRSFFMRTNKFGMYILIGAFIGGAVSLCDRSTREQVMKKSNNIVSGIAYYSKNPDRLKSKIQEKTEKYQSIYEQFSEDASYIKEKVDELKQLTPQVKELVVDTKDTFTESKDEYKSIVNEGPTGEPWK